MSDFDINLEILKRELYDKAYELGQTVKVFEKDNVVGKSVEAKQEWVDFYEDNVRHGDILDDGFKDGYFNLPKKEREQ